MKGVCVCLCVTGGISEVYVCVTGISEVCVCVCVCVKGIS